MMSINTFLVSKEIRVWFPVCTVLVSDTTPLQLGDGWLTIDNGRHGENHSVLVVDNRINRFVSYDGQIVSQVTVFLNKKRVI